MTNNKGFTLIEMLVTMTLVILVIMITGSAFESILKSTGRLVASEESNIEGMIGLEMFRYDLQQSGYGIPDTFLSLAPKYVEASYAPANLFNDGKGTSTAGNVPRPIVSLDSVSGASDTNAEISTSETSSSTSSFSILDGTDYLAIKATTVGHSKASKKWTYLNYSAVLGSVFSAKAPNKWPNTEDNFKSDDMTIVIKRAFLDDGTITNTLIFNNNNTGVAGTYWPGNPTVNMNSDFNPGKADPTYFLYGVNNYSASGLGMPFNRADFFVARPATTSSIPTMCASNTGILYKATVNHDGGKLNYKPLLDCVADMQVVFGWDVNNDGIITESSAYGSSVSVSGTASGDSIKAIMLDAIKIRKTLKYIKVYIMAQEGRKDLNFKNTDMLMNNTYSVVVGDANTSASLYNSASNVSITKGYTAADLTAKGWLNYRWKIYRIVVRPKNL
ncbi:MAG: prepilin-type N-terminal cleavage/methylation domain-containing protein [Desulfuromonadales bacterium]